MVLKGIKVLLAHKATPALSILKDLKANVEKNENAVLPVNKDQPVLKVHRAN